MLYGVSLPFLLVARKVLPAVARIMGPLEEKFRKGMEDISRTRILQKQKCAISGRLFRASPAVAGAFFRFFNQLVLSSIWLAVVGLVVVLWLLVS